MTKAHELRLAKRMARLGTETAFEVLVKARALEAKAAISFISRSGNPIFDTPENIISLLRPTLCTKASPTMGLRPVCRNCVKPSLST